MNNELFTIIEKMKIALQEAIADAENSEKSSYDGFDGQLLLTSKGEHIYQFTLKTSWDIKEHTPVYVILDRKYRADARVVSNEAHMLMLATRDALPRERLSHVKLVENGIWLLKRQLQAVTNLRETAAEFGAKTLGLLPVESGSRAVQRKLSRFTLHPNQEKAIARALGSEKTLIVGPPGTGKTAVISLLICYYLLLGFSVLLVSATNNATDNAFMRLIDVIRASDQADLRTLIEQGLVVRTGKPHQEALRQGAYREFTVNGLADAQMRKKRERLEQERCEIGPQIQDLEDLLSQKEQAWQPRRDALRKAIAPLEEALIPLRPVQEQMCKDQEFREEKAQQREEASATLAPLQKYQQDLEQARLCWIKEAEQLQQAYKAAADKDTKVRAMKPEKRLFSEYSDYDFAVAECEVARLLKKQKQADAIVADIDRKLLENQKAQTDPLDKLYRIDRDVERFCNNAKARCEHPDVVRVNQLEELLKPLAQEMKQGELPLSVVQKQITRLKEEWCQINARIEDLDVQQVPLKKQIVAQAQLVATTATSIYLNTHFQERTFDVVVVDELSMISVIGVLLVASRATKHFVGAGDPMQLAPIVTLEHKDNAPHAKEWLGKNLFTYLNISIFDAIDGSKECVLLTQQGRCHPRIIAPINHFVYQGRLTSREETEHSPGIGPHPEWPLMLVDTTTSEARCRKPSRCKPRENEHHARLAVALVQQVLESLPPRPPDDDPTVPRVAIIVPYRSQLNLIRQKLRKAGIADRVYACTVDTVQSLEFEVVIFDTVEATGIIPCKFTFDTLLDKHHMATDATRKLTVAWTRARHKLIVIAHWKHLHDHLPLDLGDDPVNRQCLLYDLVEWAASEGYITADEVFNPPLTEEE